MMSKSSPVSVVKRTLSGDSYGNVFTDDDSPGMISDEHCKTENVDEKNRYIVQTNRDENQGKDLGVELKDDQNVKEEKHNLSPNQSMNKKCEEITGNGSFMTRAETDLLYKEILDKNEKEKTNSEYINNDNENNLYRVDDSKDTQDILKREEPYKYNENEGGEMDYSKADTKENISVFVNGESRMEESDRNDGRVIKSHSINLTPEAFGLDAGYDDPDRNSQLSSYDGDDIESDISPVLLNTNCISARSENRPQTTSTLHELPGGLRAKANTPASFYKNEIDSPVYQNEKVSGRESRDEVFHRAMTLMSNRCTSARGEENGLFSSREPPFGVNIPQYFYVYQKKPQPLAPLKAWRGYKGNVYFEPMRIQRVKNNDGSADYMDSDNNHTFNSDIIPRQPPSRSMLRSAPLPQSRGSNARGFLSSSASSRPSYRLVNSSRQVYVMDKSIVVNEQNATDLRYIEGMESTGSLSVSQPDFTGAQFNPSNTINNTPFLTHNRSLQPNKDRDKRLLYKRDRICRGSNFHKSKDKSELGLGRNSTSKVLSIKISDPKKKLFTPDNSRRTSDAGSRMSVRKNATGSASSNSNLKIKSSLIRSTELIVSGDKFHPHPLKDVSSISISGSSTDLYHYHHKEGKGRRSLDDVDAFINGSDNLPRVNQVHVTLGNMTEESLPVTTSACSDNGSNDEDKQSVDFVDMNFKDLTTATTIPVDSGY